METNNTNLSSKQENVQISPAAKELRNLARRSENAPDLGNRFIFGTAVIIVVLEIIGSMAAKKLNIYGFSIELTRSDLPLLLGILITIIGNFNFYRRILEPVGESPAAALYSVMGMIAMVFLPVSLLLAELLPLRFLILGSYGMLVIIKNDLLRRRFRGTILGSRFRVWERRAIVQTLAALLAGAWFYDLLNPSLAIAPGYERVISLLFNLVFFFACTAIFVRNQRVTFDLDAVAEAETPIVAGAE